MASETHSMRTRSRRARSWSGDGTPDSIDEMVKFINDAIEEGRRHEFKPIFERAPITDVYRRVGIFWFSDNWPDCYDPKHARSQDGD
jgi:hypothetical protein